MSNSQAPAEINYGGQAVIEGVKNKGLRLGLDVYCNQPAPTAIKSSGRISVFLSGCMTIPLELPVSSALAVLTAAHCCRENHAPRIV